MTDINNKRRELFESIYPLPVGMYWLESEKQYAGHMQFWLWTDRFNTFNSALDAVDIHIPSALSDDLTLTDAINSQGLGLRIKEQP